MTTAVLVVAGAASAVALSTAVAAFSTDSGMVTCRLVLNDVLISELSRERARPASTTWSWSANPPALGS